MRDPDLVQEAERVAAELEGAWYRWRSVHGAGSDPVPTVSSYVGYSLEEPWGEPRVVLGLAARDAEQLTALLDRHECAGAPTAGAGRPVALPVPLPVPPQAPVAGTERAAPPDGLPDGPAGGHDEPAFGHETAAVRELTTGHARAGRETTAGTDAQSGRVVRDAGESGRSAERSGEAGDEPGPADVRVPARGAHASGAEAGRSSRSQAPRSESRRAGSPQAELPQAELPQAELPQAELPRSESPSGESELPRDEDERSLGRRSERAPGLVPGGETREHAGLGHDGQPGEVVHHDDADRDGAAVRPAARSAARRVSRRAGSLALAASAARMEAEVRIRAAQRGRPGGPARRPECASGAYSPQAAAAPEGGGPDDDTDTSLASAWGGPEFGEAGDPASTGPRAVPLPDPDGVVEYDDGQEGGDLADDRPGMPSAGHSRRGRITRGYPISRLSRTKRTGAVPGL